MAKTLIEWTWRRLPSTALSAQQLCAALKLGAHVEGGTVVLPGYTFNPWIGCTAVSPGCANCYAAAMDERRFSRTLGGATKDQPVIHFGKGAPRHRTSEANWRAPLQWNRQAQELGVTLRVFSASLGDWLDDEAPVEWVADFLALIAATPWLDWILVTKRPENWAKRLNAASGCYDIHTVEGKAAWGFGAKWYISGEAPPNVWIVATVEDQPRANERIPALLKIPAVVRGLSCEPLLAPVQFSNVTNRSDCVSVLGKPALTGIHWVICGGESGSDTKAPDGRVLCGIRPMHPDWARSLRDQCSSAGVPFYFKQWGEWSPFDSVDAALAEKGWGDRADLKVLWSSGLSGSAVMGHARDAWDRGCRPFKRVGKASAGKLLDGREHHAAPEPRLRADDAHKSALPAISSLTK